MPSWAIGLIAVIVVGIASVLAFTKQLPWGDPYEVQAVFSSAQSVRASSPVRIAGVNVGEVTKIEPLISAEGENLEAQAGDDADAVPLSGDEPPGQQAAVVTMELNEDALPLHEDAQFKLRPRLFLEGNLFVDLQPGSPNAEEIEDGHTFPVNQTAYSVQLDQILTTLQADVRADLQIFLDQFGNALTKYGGAEGFRELYRTSPEANRYTSQVNEAFLGTEPGDLGGLINLDRVVRGPRPQRADAEGPGHQLPHLLRLVRRRGRRARRRRSRSCRTSSRPRDPAFANLNRSFPAAARVRSRGAARRRVDARDARGRDPVHHPAPRSSSPRTSCAASSPTCARRSRSWRAVDASRSRSWTRRGRSRAASTRS